MIRKSQKVEMFGIKIDPIRMPQAISRLREWIANPVERCRFVVTPNVDHTVLLRDHKGLQAAYEAADLIVADGWPVVLAARILREPVPERVAGSDMVPALFKSATKEQPLRAYLLGAAPGVADRAAANIQQRWPAVEVVGTHSPPLGFEKQPAKNEEILQRVAKVKPDVLVVGLGAPKQELWVHAHQHQLKASVALCAGATIDFLAGQKKRAPRWVRAVGMEWCHRVMSEPRRLAKRYARDAWVFPQLVWSEMVSRRECRAGHR